MSILSQVTKGKVHQPFLGIVSGVDGVGKTTFAAQMPNVVFVGPEMGTANLDVSRLPVTESLAQLYSQLDALASEPHDFQSVAVDAIDGIEPLIWEDLVFKAGSSKIKSIEDFGYGKGYVAALDEWRKLIGKLNVLRDKRKMNVILIAHVHVKAAKDPTVIEDYDRYQLKLNDKAAALLREWVDCVFFANFETLTAKDKQGKTRAFGDGARYLFTERRAGFDAKNRFGLPFQLNLDWNELSEHLGAANPDDPAVIRHTIEQLIEEDPIEERRAKLRGHLETCGQDVTMLKKLEKQIKAIITAPAA